MSILKLTNKVVWKLRRTFSLEKNILFNVPTQFKIILILVYWNQNLTEAILLDFKLIEKNQYITIIIDTQNPWFYVSQIICDFQALIS